MNNIFNNNEKLQLNVGAYSQEEVIRLLKKVSIRQLEISILGDSYSTYAGYIPDGYPSWYPTPNQVNTVEKTWWYRFIEYIGGKLDINSSYSGSEVCMMRHAGTSFIDRKDTIGEPDVLLMFGGTNDEWRVRDSPAPGYETYAEMLGNYVYSNWTEADLAHFRPALAYLFDYYQTNHKGMKIIFILNDSLTEIVESVKTICAHYKVPLLHLSAISKNNEHPDAAGMKKICKELVEFV